MLSKETELSEELRQQLHRVASWAIEQGLDGGEEHQVDASNYPPKLQAIRATFVTLKKAGKLRGCIGSASPARPLVADVAHNAYGSAFRDPRFPPLEREEWDRIECTIAVLSVYELLGHSSEQNLLDQLRPGTDGLLLEAKGQKGTLLPSVWCTIPDPAAFLRHLKLKAGLPEDFWSDELKISRYTTESFP